MNCCYICGSWQNLQKHHVFGGSGRRKISDKYGMIVTLCIHHHTSGPYAVHTNKEVDRQLKQTFQKKFEQEHSREDFIRLFGRNYLDLEEEYE